MEAATMMYGRDPGRPADLGGPDLRAGRIASYPKTPGSESRATQTRATQTRTTQTRTTQNGEFPDRSISAIGGIETGEHAAEFLLMGASTVQVCTGVMIHGYKVVKDMCAQLSAFMDKKGFTAIDDFRGHSLQYFTTHADLVKRQAQAKAAEKNAARGMVTKDANWSGDRFVEQSHKLVANQ
jgi:hypothetical protein